MSLIDTMKECDVSLEDLVEETIVSPVDAPSAAIQVAPDVVVSTEPTVPVSEVAEQVAEAVAIVQVDAIADATQSEYEALHEKADELLDIQTTMEAYESLISRFGLKGINSQSAEIIALSLKNTARKLGVETKICSLESFEAKDLQAQHGLATVSLEDIRKTAKAAGKRFMDIIEKILELIKRIGYNYLDGINAVEKQIDKVDERLGALKTVDAGDAKLTVKGARILTINGNIDLSVPDEMKGLAHFTAVSYPDAVAKFFDGLVKGVLKFDPSSSSDEEIEAYFKDAAKPLESVSKLVDESTLPGGYTLDVSEHHLSFGIKEPIKVDEYEEEFAIPETLTLRKNVRDLKALVTQLKEIRPNVDKIDKSGKKLLEAVKRVGSKTDTDGKSKVDHLEHEVGLLIKQASPRIGEIIQYIISYVRASLRVTETIISDLEKSKSSDKDK